MNNFVFYNPTRLIFGKGQILQLSKEIPADAKVMLVYGGGSIFKNGVYEQVQTQLAKHQVVEFGGVEANPQYSTLMKGVALARAEQVDFLLAVGGGSVLDGVKFMAAAIPFSGNDPWDLLTGKAKITQSVPLGAVLTLPATGSEMNYYAVISRKETQEKQSMGNPLLFPVFSILDPETTRSLSYEQIANGIADIFSHVMEQYMTYPVNAPVQDRMAEGILITLREEAPKTLANLSDYDSRANVMWAATMALNGIIKSGVPEDWTSHGIGHQLTAYHGITHGSTLAAVLPHLLKVKRENKFEKLLQYGQRVWNLSGTNDEIVDAAIEKTTEFYESLGISTKAKTYGVTAETVTKIVDKFTTRNVVLGERKDVTPAVVQEILALSLA